MNCLLTTAYWPNLHYFYYLLNSNIVSIEQHENYQKQSYRTRCRIMSANGPLDLCIPVKNKAPKESVKNTEISHQENWMPRHWRAITSAYKNSPYFDYFEEDIRFFYTQPFSSLFDYNLQQLHTILKLLRVKKDLALTKDFEKQSLPGTVDLRALIHPKISFKTDAAVSELLSQPYYQTFGMKFNFEPNLSILDLIFNVGLETENYLRA